MTGSLKGRIALVTGASSGIGEATALALARAGATIAVSARREERLRAIADTVAAAGGGEVLVLPGDVTDEAAATAAVTRTVDRFGRLDLLVNSAGIIQAGGIEQADLAEYRQVIDVNLMATVYTCRAAIGPMRANGGGDIVNISSQAGRKTAAPFNAYSASKHALNAMSDAMRQEVGGYGIRVCVLMPGATKTEVANNVSDPNFRAAMQAHVGKDGALLSEDIADAVVFVASLPPRVNIDLISVRPTVDTSG